MAIHLPSNLYSEGQVPINSDNFTKFYLQSMAQKRAKKEAVDAYYRDLGKGLSPAGMAANDIPDFMNKIQGWKQYTIQNRDVLNDPKNPKYADAVTQAQYLYNDALEHAETSKSKVKDLYQGRQLIKPDHPFTDASLDVLNKAGAPINNGYQPLNFSQLEYDEKPYDFIAQQKDIDAALKGVQLGKTVTNIKPDPRTHTNTVTYDFQYNKDGLNDIAHRAAIAYQTNPKVKKWLDNQVTDKAQYDALNPAFQEAYGRDIQSGEDKYAAMLLMNAKQAHQQQAVTGYNPFLGQGGSNNPANKFNFGVEMTNALRTNDTNKVNQLTHILSGGNGKINVIDAFPRKEGGVDYIYLQLRDKDTDGYLGEPYTKKFAVDDPSLPDLLTNVYQGVMSSDATQEKLQYPNSQQVVVPPKQGSAAPKQKAAPTKKTIKRSDISGKAAAAGYSEDEYEKLLKQNGVQITD